MTTTLTNRADGNARASWHSLALGLASALGIFCLLLVPSVAPFVLRLEHQTADWRTALLSNRLQSPHPAIAIVTINADTIEPYPFMLPIDRSLQAKIVQAVADTGARAIALDFYYTKDTLPKPDDDLLQVLKSVKDKLIMGAYESPYALKPKQAAYQTQFLSQVGANAAFVNLAPDHDGVIRYRPATTDRSTHQESFSQLIARAAGWKGGPVPNRIGWLLPPADGSNTFLKIEAHRLLDGSAIDAAQLKDRVVIIGGDFPYFDRHRTPLSLLTGVDITGAEIHAQMATELIDGNRSYSELTQQQARLLLVLLASAGIALGTRFRTRSFDFLDWRIATIILLLADALVFKFAHKILPFTLAGLAWGLGVMLGTQSRACLAWIRDLVAKRAKA